MKPMMNRPKKGAVKGAKHPKKVERTKHPYSDRDSMHVMGKRMGSSGADRTMKSREKRLTGRAM